MTRGQHQRPPIVDVIIKADGSAASSHPVLTMLRIVTLANIVQTGWCDTSAIEPVVWQPEHGRCFY